MKTLVRAALAATALLMGAVSSQASDWTPPGPIQLMIAFRAGGGADTQARLIGEELQKRHGWEVIPQNVTGKGGLNMLAEMKGKPADGTVIGIAVTETLGYNLASAPGAGMIPADFTGIATTAAFEMGIVAASASGWDSFDQMIEAARGGQELRFGAMSPRLADLAFLLGEAQGIDLNIVEVRGGRAVLDGINAGDLDVGFMAGIQRNGVASGDLINLASAISQPLQQTPDAPLMEDLGVPFTADGQFVFLAPSGMDAEARAALTDAIIEIIQDEANPAGAMIQKAFGGPTIISGAELDALLQDGFDQSGTLLEAVSQ